MKPGLTFADLPQFPCSMVRVIRQEPNFHILVHDYTSVFLLHEAVGEHTLGRCFNSNESVKVLLDQDPYRFTTALDSSLQVRDPLS